MGVGLAAYSKDQIEKMVNELVKRGEIPIEGSKELINELVDRGEREQVELKNIVGQQINQKLNGLNIVTKDTVSALEAKVATLELELSALKARLDNEDNN